MTTETRRLRKMVVVRNKDGLIDEIREQYATPFEVTMDLYGPTARSGKYLTQYQTTRLALVENADGNISPVLPDSLNEFLPYSRLIINAEEPFDYRLVQNRNTQRSMIFIHWVSNLDYTAGREGQKHANIALAVLYPEDVRNAVHTAELKFMVDGKVLNKQELDEFQKRRLAVATKVRADWERLQASDPTDDERRTFLLNALHELADGGVITQACANEWERKLNAVEVVEAAKVELERIYAAKLPSDELMVQVVNVYKQLTDAGVYQSFTTADPNTGETVKYSHGEFTSVK